MIKTLVLKFTYKEVQPILKKKQGRLLTVDEVKNNIYKIRNIFKDRLDGSLKLLRLLAYNPSKQEVVEVVSWQQGEALLRLKVYKHNLNKCLIIYKN